MKTNQNLQRGKNKSNARAPISVCIISLPPFNSSKYLWLPFFLLAPLYDLSFLLDVIGIERPGGLIWRVTQGSQWTGLGKLVRDNMKRRCPMWRWKNFSRVRESVKKTEILLELEFKRKFNFFLKGEITQGWTLSIHCKVWMSHSRAKERCRRGFFYFKVEIDSPEEREEIKVLFNDSYFFFYAQIAQMKLI